MVPGDFGGRLPSRDPLPLRRDLSSGRDLLLGGDWGGRPGLSLLGRLHPHRGFAVQTCRLQLGPTDPAHLWECHQNGIRLGRIQLGYRSLGRHAALAHRMETAHVEP